MTQYIIQLTGGCKTWTEAELGALSFQLGSSGQTWLKSDSVVFKRLDDKGRLLISQIDDFYAGQRLHELYDVDYNATMEFGLRFSLKGLSNSVDLTAALQAQGFSSPLPLTNLSQVHMLTYLILVI